MSKNKSNIPLFENNNIQCLNISYLFRKKENNRYNNYTQYDIFNLINKNNDNFLSIPYKGFYELIFYLPNIRIKEIKFKFSGLFKPIKYYKNEPYLNSEVHLINMDKWLTDNDSFDFTRINNISTTPKKLEINSQDYFIVENSQISKEQIIKITDDILQIH